MKSLSSKIVSGIVSGIGASALISLAAGCGGVDLQDQATEEGTASEQRQIINWCLVGSAQATLTLGAYESGVNVNSSGTSYSTTACGSFTTDILVGPSAAQVPESSFPAFYVGGGDAAGGMIFGLTQAQCSQLTGSLYVYKNPGEAGSLSLVGGGGMHGVWIPPSLFMGYCTLEQNASFQAIPTFSPPASGTDQYRVVVQTRLGTTPRQVSAGANHVANP